MRMLSVELEGALQEKLDRESLIDYTVRMYPGYEVGAIHREIAHELELAAETPRSRLLIIVPPRFGKSELASVQFPSWYLGRHPGREIIAATHTQELTNQFSRRARRNIQSPDYPFRDTVKIPHDARAVENWEVEGVGEPRRGRYQAFGVGGGLAGRGANFLIIDDAVKNAEDANSPTMREKTWEWFQTDAVSRLQPGASMAVIGTRWHWDDLIGRIIKGDKEKHRWKIIYYKALNDQGESLDPQRWPLDELLLKREEVGSRVWESLYQGNPTADEGAIIKKDWIGRYQTLPPGILYLIQSWDTAFKSGEKNDFSVCHTYAVTVYGLYLVGRYRAKPEFPDLVRAAKAQYAEFSPKYVLIEDKGSGQSLLQVLAKETRIPAIPIPVPNGEGKIIRVEQATPYLESRRLFVPDWAPWTDDVISEWTSFPLGTHDDEVDAMIQAVLREFGTPEAAPVRSQSYIDNPEDDDDELPVDRDGSPWNR